MLGKERTKTNPVNDRIRKTHANTVLNIGEENVPKQLQQGVAAVYADKRDGFRSNDGRSRDGGRIETMRLSAAFIVTGDAVRAAASGLTERFLRNANTSGNGNDARPDGFGYVRYCSDRAGSRISV